jgi:ankyrin repeat protein
MCKAAASRDMEYVERLVKAGVDPNVVDYSQRTPLHVVAAQGTAEAVKFLLQEGADVFARDRLVLYRERERERESICSTINAVMHLSAQFGVFLRCDVRSHVNDSETKHLSYMPHYSKFSLSPN